MSIQLPKLVGEVVKECLEEGSEVGLEGLGVFRRTDQGVAFVPESGPRVFIAYVVEDYSYAERLYPALEAAGFRPWLDRKKLLPGQDWRHCIERAIETCDFFIACFSRRAVLKRGQFPYEVRYALRTAERMPLDDVFVLPVRFQECRIPMRIAWTMQYADLFPDWDKGLVELIESLRTEWVNRKLRASA